MFNISAMSILHVNKMVLYKYINYYRIMQSNTKILYDIEFYSQKITIFFLTTLQPKSDICHLNSCIRPSHIHATCRVKLQDDNDDNDHVRNKETEQYQSVHHQSHNTSFEFFLKNKYNFFFLNFIYLSLFSHHKRTKSKLLTNALDRFDRVRI